MQTNYYELLYVLLKPLFCKRSEGFEICKLKALQVINKINVKR